MVTYLDCGTGVVFEGLCLTVFEEYFEYIWHEGDDRIGRRQLTVGNGGRLEKEINALLDSILCTKGPAGSSMF